MTHSLHSLPNPNFVRSHTFRKFSTPTPTSNKNIRGVHRPQNLAHKSYVSFFTLHPDRAYREPSAREWGKYFIRSNHPHIDTQRELPLEKGVRSNRTKYLAIARFFQLCRSNGALHCTSTGYCGGAIVLARFFSQHMCVVEHVVVVVFWRLSPSRWGVQLRERLAQPYASGRLSSRSSLGVGRSSSSSDCGVAALLCRNVEWKPLARTYSRFPPPATAPASRSSRIVRRGNRGSARLPWEMARGMKCRAIRQLLNTT